MSIHYIYIMFYIYLLCLYMHFLLILYIAHYVKYTFSTIIQSHNILTTSVEGIYVCV